MKTFTFPSVARPTWRYRLYERSDENPAHNWRQSQYAISDVLSQFDTMGDGETQHSPDVLVQNEDFCDLLNGLVINLHRIPVDVEITPRWLTWFWRMDVATEDQIRFALSLKYNIEKPLYYCLTEQKRSSSSEKRHDKRWEELRHYDGDCPIEKVMQIICTESSKCRPHNIIQHVAIVLRIAEVADRSSARFLLQQYFRRGPGVFQGMERDRLQAMIDHFEIITSFVESLSELTRTRGFSRRVAERLVSEESRQHVAVASES